MKQLHVNLTKLLEVQNFNLNALKVVSSGKVESMLGVLLLLKISRIFLV